VPPAVSTGLRDTFEDDDPTNPRAVIVRRKTPRRMAPNSPRQQLPPGCPIRCALDRSTMRLKVSIDAGVVMVPSGARAYAQHPHTRQITECVRPRPDEGMAFEMDVTGCSGVFFGLDLPNAKASYVAYLEFPKVNNRWTQVAGKF
jgi:hypothetical protein